MKFALAMRAVSVANHRVVEILPPSGLIRGALAAAWEGLWCGLLRGQPHAIETVGRLLHAARAFPRWPRGRDHDPMREQHPPPPAPAAAGGERVPPVPSSPPLRDATQGRIGLDVVVSGRSGKCAEGSGRPGRRQHARSGATVSFATRRTRRRERMQALSGPTYPALPGPLTSCPLALEACRRKTSIRCAAQSSLSPETAISY